MSSGQSDLIALILRNRPVITVSALTEVGVTRAGLDSAVRRNQIVKVAQGVVASPEAEASVDLNDAVACLISGGIICHRTAGFRHGLTDDLPNEIEMLVPHAIKRAPPVRLPMRYVRSSAPESFTLGIQERQSLGVTVRMTDRTRTVVDLVRGSIRQHAVAAVHTYLAEGGNGQDLDDMARPFGVQDRIAPLVEATLQTLSRTIGR